MSYGPSTRTVADVMRAVKRTFGDESGVQLEDADVFMWINDAQDEIVRRNQVLKATSTSLSVVGQKDYSYPNDLILKVESIHYDGQRLENISFAQAEESIIHNSNLVNRGTPEFWYEWAGKFSFLPVPDTALSITMYYTKKPARIALVGDLLSVPDKYYQNVVAYVLQQAYEMDEDWQASQVKQQQFDLSLNDMGEEERTAQNMTYQTVTVVD